MQYELNLNKKRTLTQKRADTKLNRLTEDIKFILNSAGCNIHTPVVLVLRTLPDIPFDVRRRKNVLGHLSVDRWNGRDRQPSEKGVNPIQVISPVFCVCSINNRKMFLPIGIQQVSNCQRAGYRFRKVTAGNDLADFFCYPFLSGLFVRSIHEAMVNPLTGNNPVIEIPVVDES